ncbi:hypothetical protein O3M35_001891 [Rhynocoris fuscipes]
MAADPSVDGIVDNPVDRQKRNLSSLNPEDLLPESSEIKRNLQHQPVMVGLECHRLGYGNIQDMKRTQGLHWRQTFVWDNRTRVPHL